MGRRLLVLTLVCAIALEGPGWAQVASEPDPCPESVPVAECFRQAAEGFKGRWREAEARRRYAEAELADVTASRDRWRDAAQTAVRPVTPDWVWPTAAGLAVVMFVVGFVVAARVPQSTPPQ